MKGYVINGDRVTVTKESLPELENNVREIDNEIAEIKEKTFIEPIKQRLFYDGQYFDAYDFICSLIFGANKSITLMQCIYIFLISIKNSCCAYKNKSNMQM